MSTSNRSRSGSLLLILALAATQVAASDDRPLAVHMNQWLVGSREWTTPNPDHDPASDDDVVEFRVRWNWGPFGQQLQGELFGVCSDDSTVSFWRMTSTYNPVTQTVLFQQIGRGGDYVMGEQPVREAPLTFGETERLDTTLFAADGSTRFTRHETVFAPDGTHRSRVYEMNETGTWTLRATWDWRLVDEAEVRGDD